jgi:hypothetical protein
MPVPPQKLLQVYEQVKITWNQVQIVERMEEDVPGKISK